MSEAMRQRFEKVFPVPENVRWNPDWCGRGRYEPDNALLHPEAEEVAFIQQQRWIGFKNYAQGQEPVAWVSPARWGSAVSFVKPRPPEGWEDQADDWFCTPLIYGGEDPEAVTGDPGYDLPDGYSVHHELGRGWYWYDDVNDRPAQSDYRSPALAAIGAWKDSAHRNRAVIGAEHPSSQKDANSDHRDSFCIPDGYALVPEKMTLDWEAMENILSMTGDEFTQEAFPECILWVGETFAEEGAEPRYGLNIACVECLEDGSNPILYFEEPDLGAAKAKNAHVDDRGVDAFAAAMKSKLAKKREQGYDGWDDPKLCPTGRLQNMLLEHVSKGDPVDVGNFAMMLWNRGESLLPK